MLFNLSLSELTGAGAPGTACIAALGMFDGVHLGHLAVLREAAAWAYRLGLPSLVFTLDRQPLEVVQPQKAAPYLTTTATRVNLLQQHVDHVVVAKFDAQFANVSAGDFVKLILRAALRCRGVVVGFNYTFGRRAEGDVNLLRRLGAEHGIEVAVAPPVTSGETTISSTAIRQLLAAGAVEQAARLLGRAYALEGVVGRGKAIGRQLGFPTANLVPFSQLLIPDDGVYLTNVRPMPEGELLGYGVTAISTRPTVDGESRTVETHVIDWQGNLYDRHIAVEFHSRLRGILTFASLAQLREQIAADVAAARQQISGARLQ